MAGQREVNLELLGRIFQDDISVCGQIDPEPGDKNGHRRENTNELYQILQNSKIDAVTIAGSTVENPESIVKVAKECRPVIRKPILVAPSHPLQMLPDTYHKIFPNYIDHLLVDTVFNSESRDPIIGYQLLWNKLWKAAGEKEAPWENSILTPYLPMNKDSAVYKILNVNKKINVPNLFIPDVNEAADLACWGANLLGTFYLETSGEAIQVDYVEKIAEQMERIGYNKDSYLLIGGGLDNVKGALERIGPSVKRGIKTVAIIGDSWYEKGKNPSEVVDAIKSYSPR